MDECTALDVFSSNKSSVRQSRVTELAGWSQCCAVSGHPQWLKTLPDIHQPAVLHYVQGIDSSAFLIVWLVRPVKGDVVREDLCDFEFSGA